MRFVRKRSVSAGLILLTLSLFWYGRAHRTEGDSRMTVIQNAEPSRVEQQTKTTHRGHLVTRPVVNVGDIRAPTREEYEQMFLNQLVQNYRRTIALSTVAAQRTRQEPVANLAKMVIAEQNQRIGNIEQILMSRFDKPLPPEIDLRGDAAFQNLRNTSQPNVDRLYLEALANQHQADIGLAKNVPTWTNQDDILAVSQEAMAEETKEIVQINDMQQSFGFPITTVAGEATGRFDSLTPTGNAGVAPERSYSSDASGIVPGTVNGGVVNLGHFATEEGNGPITSITPTYQSDTEQDRVLVQRIHGALAADKNVSLAGQNINVTAEKGTVTLRGLVSNRDEHDRVFSIVRGMYGVGQIQDQLEILKK